MMKLKNEKNQIGITLTLKSNSVFNYMIYAGGGKHYQLLQVSYKQIQAKIHIKYPLI